MGIVSKFTNWVSNKAQGISNKLGNAWNNIKDTASNAWEKTKGTASKIWEGTKDVAKKAGQFIYDNSDTIASVLGGAAMGAAGYYGGPEAALALREGMGSIANALPEGKMKDALLSAAWKKKKSQVETPIVNLTKEVPGGNNYVNELNAYKTSVHKPSTGITVNSTNNNSGRYINDNVVHPSATVIYEGKKPGKHKKRIH